MTGGADPFGLSRFVIAQDPVYDQARRELAAGAKASHWMWFVFPQLKGLGHSAMAERYGIGSLAEAQAYLAHVLLGPRLRDCTNLVLKVVGRTAHEIFGAPDDLKFRSSMTLFAVAAEGGDATSFDAALRKYFSGQRDAVTLRLLAQAKGAPS